MTLRQLEASYSRACLGSVQEFIRDVRTASRDGSIPTLHLIGFLDGRTMAFLAEGRRICRLGEAMSREENRSLTLHGQILAAEMLFLKETRSMDELRSKMLLFLEYASAVVKGRYDLVGKAADTLSWNCSSLGYDWTAVENATSLETIAYCICSSSVMDKASPAGFSFREQGRVQVEDGRISICASTFGDCPTKAFSAFSDRLDVMTRNVREERLKASEAEDADRLFDFGSTFIDVQKDSAAAGNPARNRVRPGDRVTVRCTGTLRNDEGKEQFTCTILDTTEGVSAVIAEEELVYNLWTSDLIPYICQGDCIEGAQVVSTEGGVAVSIKEAYVKYAAARQDELFRSNTAFESVKVRNNSRNDRVIWMTAGGFGAVSYTDNIPEGDEAILNVMNMQKKNSGNVFINVCQPRYGYDGILRFDPDMVLADFVIQTAEAIARIKEREAEQAGDSRAKETVRSLAAICAACSSCKDPVGELRRLLCSSFLYRCIGDEEPLGAIRTRAAFLKCCISYAQTGRAGSVPRDIVLPSDRLDILGLLSIQPGEEDIPAIASKIDGRGLGHTANGIASLLLTRGLSHTFPDEIRATSDDIRRKICELLGVAERFRTGETARNGKYGRGENSNREFKSSYVFRNDGGGEMIPDLAYQGRGQVFEAVCGMLNRDGGEVYIGVNDAGDPITAADRGLAADIQWLSSNHVTLDTLRSRQLGHHIPKADSVGHMVLFLNAEKELYFRDTLQDNITIESTDDQDAIRITVRPARYEIAYLFTDRTRTEGTAYVRDGERTIPMSRHEKEKRLMSLKDISRNIGAIVAIQEAIDRQQKLVFRNYASGNSGRVRDRFVVPINLFYNDENVYCWDLEAQGYRQFRLARMTGVEQVTDSPDYPNDFRPRKADVFRWISDDRPFHIKVRMDVGARNYLLEEYSNAVNLPTSEFYEETPGKWILDTHLQGLGAIRRFYLGLADKIEILETEDSRALEDDIQAYMKQHLSRFLEED